MWIAEADSAAQIPDIGVEVRDYLLTTRDGYSGVLAGLPDYSAAACWCQGSEL